MKHAGPVRNGFALLAGIATVFGFAPFGLSALPVVTLMLLVLLLQSAESPRAAAWMGFAFGLGLFGGGGSWVFIALNTFGGMPLLLAAIGTAGFCAYIALYVGAAGWLAARWTHRGSWQRALAAAAAWTFAEWIHTVGFASFPWLALGYAQLRGAAVDPLAGYAPAGGVFAVTLAMTLVAAASALVIEAVAAAARARAAGLVAVAAIVIAGGAALRGVEWTSPVGAPVAVTLVQGNITQDEKFDPELRQATFDLFLDLIDKSRGRLVVLPESAFPVFADDVPDAVFLHVQNAMRARDGDALVGMFTADLPETPDGDVRYYNSVLSIGVAKMQRYRKRHLVPFGETIPFEPVVGWFIRKVLAIPLAGQTPGDADQPVFEIAGQKVAVDICYEDAFGADIRPQAGNATLLVNVTNDAWYGHSLAAEQHNQIAAMRALETGRPLLRATNTGITSAISHDGRELARLPWYTRGLLEIEVTGRRGITPFVAFGNAPVVVFSIVLFLIASVSSRAGRNIGT